MEEYSVKELNIVDIKIPFWSIVIFMVKATIASIPAMIILTILAAMFTFAGIFLEEWLNIYLWRFVNTLRWPASIAEVLEYIPERPLSVLSGHSDISVNTEPYRLTVNPFVHTKYIIYHIDRYDS